MTTTETIFAAWLFLLTLAAISLFAAARTLRNDVNAVVSARVPPPAKPKRKPSQLRPSKADLPIRLVPTDPAIPVGERIDLTTPMAESADTNLYAGAVTFGNSVVIDPTLGASGVGGSKPDDEGSSA